MIYLSQLPILFDVMTGIRLNAFIVFLSTLLLLVGSNYIIQYLFIMPSFEQLEDDKAEADLSEVLGAISVEVNQLETLSDIAAHWNDFKDFSRHEQLFDASRLSFLMILNNQRDIVFKKLLFFDENDWISIPEFETSPWANKHPVLEEKNIYGHKGGIYLSSTGPVIFSSRPIVDQNKKIIGNIILGRVLDKLFTGMITTQTNINIKLWPTYGSNLIPVNIQYIATELHNKADNLLIEKEDAALRVYTEIPSIIKKSGIILSIITERPITSFGKAASQKIYLTLSITGIILFLGMIFLLEKKIIEPINKFTQLITKFRQTNQSFDISYLNRKDEIGKLAKEFNYLTSDLGFARKYLRQHTYNEGLELIVNNLIQYLYICLGNNLKELKEKNELLKQFPIKEMEAIYHQLHFNPIQDENAQKISASLNTFISKYHKLPKEVYQDLQAVIHNVQRVLYTITQKTPAVQSSLEEDHIIVKDLIENAFLRIPEDLSHNIKLTFQIKLPSFSSIATYRLMLNYVLIELLENACEAIKKVHKSGEITIKCEAESLNERRYAHLIIEDNGCGIPNEQLEQVFIERYRQKPTPRLGLGLFWCRLACAAMNGQIYATSAGSQKGGCRLHVVLPINTKI